MIAYLLWVWEGMGWTRPDDEVDGMVRIVSSQSTSFLCSFLVSLHKMKWKWMYKWNCCCSSPIFIPKVSVFPLVVKGEERVGCILRLLWGRRKAPGLRSPRESASSPCQDCIGLGGMRRTEKENSGREWSNIIYCVVMVGVDGKDWALNPWVYCLNIMHDSWVNPMQL